MDLLFRDHRPARRRFIKGVGEGALGLFALTTLGGCESLLEAIRNRPTRYRLNASSAAVQPKVQIYRDAVRAMKALPASDPRSWTAQASVHGTVAGGFNLCQHGTPHFLSWHRAYLFHFEKICRKLTGEKTFALPYWNWNQDGNLHPAFTDPASPLFHSRTNTSLTGFAPVSGATLDPIFGDPNFLTFSSTFEGPHGNVHVFIGQDMATGGSAFDPVFWMHHGMVDYGWYKWNVELGFDNPDDSGWLGTTWNHFVEDDGSPASTSAAATVLMPLLAYQYESSAIGSHPATPSFKAARDFEAVRRRVEKGAPVQLDIRLRIPVVRETATPIAKPYSSPPLARAGTLVRLLTQDDPSSNAFLRIAYARFPQANDFLVRVFINHPAADATTPTSDPHYAGSVSFFGSPGGRHEQMHSTTQLVNVTPVLRALMARGELREDTPLTVQLVAVPVGERFRRPDLVLQLGEVELLVTPVVVRKPAQ